MATEQALLNVKTDEKFDMTYGVEVRVLTNKLKGRERESVRCRRCAYYIWMWLGMTMPDLAEIPEMTIPTPRSEDGGRANGRTGKKKGETFFEREEKIPLQPIEFLYRIVSRVLYYSFCVFKKIGALLLLFLTSSAFFLRGTGRQFFDGLQVFV